MIHTFYRENDSFLHSLDPRAKIVGSTSALAIILLFNDPIITGSLLLSVLILGKLLGKISIREQLTLLKPLIPLVLFTIILWPVIYKPRLEGFMFGVSFALRLLALGLVTFILLMTTPQRELIQGFVKLGLPYEFGLTISIGLRYIPTLYILTRNIMDAQRSRGWEMEKGNIIVRIRKMSAVMIPLLVASLKTAHELSIALESRAFGAGKRRTFLHDIKMGKKDYITIVTSLVLLGMALYLRYGFGFGHIKVYG